MCAHPVDKEVRVVGEEGENLLLVVEIVGEQERSGRLRRAKNLASLHGNSSRQCNGGERPRDRALRQRKLLAPSRSSLGTVRNSALCHLLEM